MVAVEVDHVVLVVCRVDGQLVAQLVEPLVVELVAVAPEHQAALATGQRAGDGDKAALWLGVDVLDAQTNQIVEGFHQVDLPGLKRTCRVHRHVELIVERFFEVVHRQERTPAFHVEHVAQQVVVLRFFGHAIEQITRARWSTQMQVVQRIFVAF